MVRAMNLGHENEQRELEKSTSELNEAMTLIASFLSKLSLEG